MFRRLRSQLSTVVVTIRSTTTEDKGVGIVIMMNPMTLLVPRHLIEALCEDATTQIAVNGATYEKITLLPSAELEKDELAVIRVRGRQKWPIACARIPRQEARLRVGQDILLGGASASKALARRGTIVELRERADGITIITDVSVGPGDSGSAVILNRNLVAVCQGMLPCGNGGVAIAMPLSRASLEQLRSLRRLTFWRRGMPALVAIAVAIGLGIVGTLQGGITSAVSRRSSLGHSSGGTEAMASVGPSGIAPSLAVIDWLASLGNDLPEDDASNYTRLISEEDLDGAIGGMRWRSLDPTDLTCWTRSQIPEGAKGVEIIVAASESMKIRLWFASNCDYESSLSPTISEVPQTYSFPFSSWNGKTDYHCTNPNEPGAGDYLDRIMLLPSSESGELRVYGMSFLYE